MDIGQVCSLYHFQQANSAHVILHEVDISYGIGKTLMKIDGSIDSALIDLS